ncbi:MAG: hypothetical protein QOI61_1398 [Actinomycetota bacterium]
MAGLGSQSAVSTPIGAARERVELRATQNDIDPVAIGSATLALRSDHAPIATRVARNSPAGAASTPLLLFGPEEMPWRGLATVDGLVHSNDISSLLLGRLALAALSVAVIIEELTVLDAVSLVVSHIAAMGSWTEASAQRMAREIGRWAAYLRQTGVDLLVDIDGRHVGDFVRGPVFWNGRWSDPAASTMRFRIASARLLFRSLRQLHIVLLDPTQDIQIEAVGSRATRPLTDEEELLCRFISAHTLTETRRPIAWALGQATATAGEQAQARVSDVDLHGGRVWLRGTSRREPRWGYLTEWGINVMARAIEQAQASDSGLVYGAQRSPVSGTASVCKAVYAVIRDAGYDAKSGIRPGSLAAWRGVQIYEETGRIEDVKHRLGMRSFDETARVIGWTPQ